MRGTVAVLLILFAGAVLAQQQIDFTRVQQAQEKASAPPVTDTALQAAQTQYAIENFRHRSETFRWQLTSSKVIFWMVLGLVITGVIFSAVQFGIALRRKTDFSDAELALSAEGVKIRSQFLGVITLALSLGFFYLYLKTVYPITELP